MAENGPFAAISSPGGRKMVDKSCSRFDMDKENLGQWVEPFSGSGKVFGGAPQPPKVSKNGPNAGGVWRPLKACSYPGKVQIYS